MAEAIDQRCCMCPCIGKKSTVCPGIPGTQHPNDSPCRFVKEYVDQRGWKYKVMSGIGPDTFKARYQKAEKTGETGWKGVAALPWRKTFDEAQEDLNEYARIRNWKER